MTVIFRHECFPIQLRQIRTHELQPSSDLPCSSGPFDCDCRCIMVLLASSAGAAKWASVSRISAKKGSEGTYSEVDFKLPRLSEEIAC